MWRSATATSCAAAPVLATNEDELAWQIATHAEIVRRLASATTGPGTSADIETWVTPETWRSAVDQVAAAMTRLHAEARPPHTEGTIHVSASTQGFVMGDGA